jgi:hypothetical protein
MATFNLPGKAPSVSFQKHKMTVRNSRANFVAAAVKSVTRVADHAILRCLRSFAN